MLLQITEWECIQFLRKLTLENLQYASTVVDFVGLVLFQIIEIHFFKQIQWCLSYVNFNEMFPKRSLEI